MMSKLQSDSNIRANYNKADLFGKISLVISTWFGIGLIPFAPGTFGTLGSLPLIFFLNNFGSIYKGAAVLIISVAAIWSAGRTERLAGKHDPHQIVIDEVAGFLLTMILLPISWFSLCSGFIFFRFFDILKPFPIKSAERLKGGFGIVIDDLIAGLYTSACVKIIITFYG